MKVVFFEDVEGTAQVGEVKEVKAGFARNFLLPRGMAGPTSRENIQRATALAQKESRRMAKMDAEAKAVVGGIEGLALTLEARLGENGRLFGSVTNRDIAEKLAAAGHTVDAHIIQLHEPIRELGERKVIVRFTRNVSTELTVNVVPDEASRAILERIEAEQKAAEEAEAKRLAEMAYAAQQRGGRRRRNDDDDD
jgi:large subunit ribosomal protein L9